MKYRKTALIEAEQYKPGMEDGIENGKPYLNTLEGQLFIPENGWIATGAKGERWAIQDDIFRTTYELVEDTGTKKNMDVVDGYEVEIDAKSIN